MPSSQIDTSAGGRASARGTILKENVDFIKPDMWPITAMILIHWIMLFVVPSSNESIADEYDTIKEFNVDSKAEYTA